MQRNIRKALVQLADDPLTSRPGVDVKRLQATKPPKNRLRAGRYRVVYVVAGKEVRVLEVFAREKGYTE
ncbi:MAG: type II toxin-antitoxin system RelE/ParE family toxin [Euryarchaeota archaeon]|nr:type II toxin-antitoxin system RelE/ParE family toxin [Euryarchaeota archaeon]